MREWYFNFNSEVSQDVLGSFCVPSRVSWENRNSSPGFRSDEPFLGSRAGLQPGAVMAERG